eukprot:5833110-Ditylum_brightwellii.AAC.1
MGKNTSSYNSYNGSKSTEKISMTNDSGNSYLNSSEVEITEMNCDCDASDPVLTKVCHVDQAVVTRVH